MGWRKAGGRGRSPVTSIARAEHLTRVYLMGQNEVRALDDLSLDVAEGDYCAIMGPSGSGKSTLLNILGCLDRPTSGRYLIGGRDVSRLDDDELSEIRGRDIGFIFQSFNLIPQLTVLENIQVPLFYQGVPPRQAAELAREHAQRVGLTDRAHHRPSELSGGQQQRVAVARALVGDPLFILADEPTGNLDTSTGEEILQLLAGLNRQGKTLIVVTHDETVAEHADRVIRMVDGRIHQIEEKEPLER